MLIDLRFGNRRVIRASELTFIKT